MEAVQTATYPRGLDFEQVWAALMENREQLKETDRIIKENAKQHDRELKEIAERQKEFDREMKENKAEFNERLGNYINLFGDFNEYTMAPKLREKFTEFGFDFLRTNRNVRVRDKNNNIFLKLTLCWKTAIKP